MFRNEVLPSSSARRLISAAACCARGLPAYSGAIHALLSNLSAASCAFFSVATSGSDGLEPSVTLDCGLCDGKYDHADNCPGVDGASREVHQCPNPNALLCLCPDKAGQ